MSQNNDEAVQASPSETREDTSSLVSSGHSGNRPEETSNQLVRGEMASQPAEPFNMSSSSSIVTTSSSESGRGIPAFGSSLGIQNLDQSLTSLMPENQFIVHSNPSVRTSAQTNQFLISRARSALVDSSLSLVASRAIGNHSVSEIRNVNQFNATANPSAIPATSTNQEDILSDQLTVVSSESGSALSYNQLNTFTNLSSNVGASGHLLRALVNQTLTQVVNSNINQISSSANLSSTPSLNFNHMSTHAHRANQPPTSDIHHLSMPRTPANQVPTSSWAHQSLTQFGQPNRPSVPNVQSNFLFTGTSEPVTSSTPAISSSRRLQTSTVFTNSILAVPVASTYPSWSSISHTLFTGTNSQLTPSTPSTSNINTSQPPAASQNLAGNSRTPSMTVINTSQPSAAIQNISGNSRTPSMTVINTSQPSAAIQNISGNSRTPSMTVINTSLPSTAIQNIPGNSRTPSMTVINTAQPSVAIQNIPGNSRTPSMTVINTAQPSAAIQNISGNSRTPSTSVINTSQPSAAIQNISGNSTFGVTHAPSPASHTMRSQTGNSTLNAPSKGEHRPSYEELAVIAGRAKRPEMALVRKRMESFADWPENRNPTKEDLVDAGFYTTGQYVRFLNLFFMLKV